MQLLGRMMCGGPDREASAHCWLRYRAWLDAKGPAAVQSWASAEPAAIPRRDANLSAEPETSNLKCEPRPPTTRPGHSARKPHC